MPDTTPTPSPETEPRRSPTFYFEEMCQHLREHRDRHADAPASWEPEDLVSDMHSDHGIGWDLEQSEAEGLAEHAIRVVSQEATHTMAKPYIIHFVAEPGGPLHRGNLYETRADAREAGKVLKASCYKVWLTERPTGYVRAL